MLNGRATLRYSTALNSTLYLLLIHRQFKPTKYILLRAKSQVFQCKYSVIHSVEIPTRCSFVTEFIIPKVIEGSTCFEWHTTHHQEL